MVFAVWACQEPPPDGLAELEDALVASRARARAPSRSSSRTRRAQRTATRPAGSRATSSSSATASGRASAPGCCASSSWRATSASWTRCRSCASSHERGAGMTTVAAPCAQRPHDPRPGARRRAHQRRGRDRAARVARPRRRRPGRRRAARRDAPTRTRSRSSSTATSTTRTSASPTATSAPSTGAPATAREGYLLPKPVIFKKIEETLAIGGTGVLMQGGHHPDLGDRLLRGPVQLDQGALPDPPARAVAARDRAHRAPLAADHPGDAHAAARRRPRLAAGRRRRDPRRPRARIIAPKKTTTASG